MDAIFQKAWKSAARFRCGSGFTSDRVRRKVRAWLLAISKHTLIDILRGVPADEVIPLDEAILCLGTDDETVPGNLVSEQSVSDVLATTTPRRKTLVLKFLQQTDRRTRAILSAMGDHWSPSSEQCEFPPEVKDALCNEFSIGKDSLRTYCRRALEALKNYIKQNE